jgi:hypothetical protein
MKPHRQGVAGDGERAGVRPLALSPPGAQRVELPQAHMREALPPRVALGGDWAVHAAVDEGHEAAAQVVGGGGAAGQDGVAQSVQTRNLELLVRTPLFRGLRTTT